MDEFRMKKFLIIGNVNAITYKDIFPLIKDNKMWLGPSISSGDRAFYVPDTYPLEAAGCGVDTEGKRFIRVKGVRWFTNIEHNKRHTPLDLHECYNSEKHQKYDNYNAVNCSKTVEIPMDYDGIIGVPITFLDKYCPEQFEIIGLTSSSKENTYGQLIGNVTTRAMINNKKIYARILIRKKK